MNDGEDEGITMDIDESMLGGGAAGGNVPGYMQGFDDEDDNNGGGTQYNYNSMNTTGSGNSANANTNTNGNRQQASSD